MSQEEKRAGDKEWFVRRWGTKVEARRSTRGSLERNDQSNCFRLNSRGWQLCSPRGLGNVWPCDATHGGNSTTHHRPYCPRPGRVMGPEVTLASEHGMAEPASGGCRANPTVWQRTTEPSVINHLQPQHMPEMALASPKSWNRWSSSS